MTGRPWIGLGIAIFVESAHWTRIRWDFDDAAIIRATQAVILAAAATTAAIWLSGYGHTALADLATWVPALLLPLFFIQAFGTKHSMSVGIFSILARQRKARNLRFGLTDESPEFHFGNVFLIATMASAAISKDAHGWWFLAGIVLLVSWKLLSVTRGLLLLPVILAAGLLAMAGDWGLEKLSHWVGFGMFDGDDKLDPNFSPTMIGTQGTVDLSPTIIWRIHVPSNQPPPPRLKVASYNFFLGSQWRNDNSVTYPFTETESITHNDQTTQLLNPASTDTAPFEFSLRGSLQAEGLLPIPGDASALKNFDFQHLGRNVRGMVRAYPNHPVISGIVAWNSNWTSEDLPTKNDLTNPNFEQQTIHDILASIGIQKQQDLPTKLAIIQSWFAQNFRYTRNLTIKRPIYGRTQSHAITQFLTTVRSGHCEYFATATTLMLREAGIPARYATGYAVVEKDPNSGNYLVRGTHAHAWCRYWDAASACWRDFDTTPPGWIDEAAARTGFWQQLCDRLKCLKEDFSLWRNQSSIRTIFTHVALTIGLIMSMIILRRLWRSKRRIAHPSAFLTTNHARIHTPLHDLEHRAAKVLGPRPLGQPYAHWLAQLDPHFPATLDEAIRIHQRIRFDPHPAPPAELDRLKHLSQLLEAALKKSNISRCWGKPLQ